MKNAKLLTPMQKFARRIAHILRPYVLVTMRNDIKGVNAIDNKTVIGVYFFEMEIVSFEVSRDEEEKHPFNPRTSKCFHPKYRWWRTIDQKDSEWKKW